MGLNDSSGTLVAPKPKGIIDPEHRQAGRCGRSVLRRDQQRAGRQGLSGHLDRGADHLGAHRLADVDDLRSGLLRGRDDAHLDAALRRRALRRRAARVAAPVRRHDRRRHADQQDGAGAAQGLRPDAGAALRHLDGLLRQWRRLLSLFLFGGARLRPRRAGRHLCARLPADAPKRCSTAFFSCRRRSAAPARSNGEAP